VHINVLGETEVVDDGGALRLRRFGGTKPRQVLEILVLNRQPVAKEQLADLLWERRAPLDRISTLESYVSVLRARIEPGVTRANSVIVTGNGTYTLDRTRVSVDLDEFERLVHASSGQPSAVARPMLLAALELARSPLLAHEPYAPWASTARDWHQARVLAATLEAAQLSLELEDVESAANLAANATRLDSLSEHACQLLMRAHWAAGRRSDALRCYDVFRRNLRDEMGVDPSESTRSLFAAILATDAGVGAAAPHDLSALVEAVVELYRRSCGVPAAGRSGLPCPPVRLMPRQARRSPPMDGPERLLSELLALARIPSVELAVAQ
jgi:DNA-binding SARP family transcriptional activator